LGLRVKSKRHQAVILANPFQVQESMQFEPTLWPVRILQESL